MQAVARKALRPSGRSGRLSLFHHLHFQVYQKPGSDLPTLTQTELVGRLHGLEEPARFACAAYLGELSFRLASPEVAAKIWPILVSGLKGVAKHANPRLVLVWAGWRILKAAGLSPNLQPTGHTLEAGSLNEAERGVFLGAEGAQALRAVLSLPGQEAIELLANAPIERLLRALKAHAEAQVGGINSGALLR